MFSTSTLCKPIALALLAAGPLAWSQDQDSQANAPAAQSTASSPEASKSGTRASDGAADSEKKKSASVAMAQPSSKPAAPSKPMNLYLGNAHELLDRNEWETLVASQPEERDPFSEEEPPAETVKVKSTRPPVPDGIGGLFWAIRHPSQAWRLFAPATTEADEQE